MKLTKKIEAEIKQIMNDYWNAYFEGDLDRWANYLVEDYWNIGGTEEEIWNSKQEILDYTNRVIDQMVGMTEIRNKTSEFISYEPYVMFHEYMDIYLKVEEDWIFYQKFRISTLLQKIQEEWKVLHQHGSYPDSKTHQGEAVGTDALKVENEKLQEAVKNRTTELEAKNRELQLEGALERIRAQATSMQKSSDLLDVVVTMRTEFIKLGHEAHYFWHMLWSPEIYQKAMTSADGTRIGFVMELPRHIHGDIPLLANWEKSDESTVIYPMDADEANAYVHKMVTLGDFQNIDPQAPSEDDIRDIGGLTFIMARTTHGEIGYSLPGVVTNPPQEDLDIFVRFAGAFDLAHLRFLDLKKAEAQARKVQIELALERVRSRTMAMQRSNELAETASTLFQQIKGLSFETWSCGFCTWQPNEMVEVWMGADSGGLLPPMMIPYKKEPTHYDIYQASLDETDVYEKVWEGKALEKHYEYLRNIPSVATAIKQMEDAGLSLPARQCYYVGFFKKGYLLLITKKPHAEMYELSRRFAKVFEQAYTRFLDLQKAETQAREGQIELALEKIRSRTMVMQHSNELPEAANLLFLEVQALGIPAWSCGFNVLSEDNKTSDSWMSSEGAMQPPFSLCFTKEVSFIQMFDFFNSRENFYVQELEGKDLEAHYNYMRTIPKIGEIIKNLEAKGISLPNYQINHLCKYTNGYLLFITYEQVPDAHDIFKRFTQVFEQTYTRFLDLQKAEAQARESQIEAAVERVRAEAMGMHSTTDFEKVTRQLLAQVQKLNIEGFTGVVIILIDENEFITGYDFSSPGNLGDPKNRFFKYAANKYPIIGVYPLDTWKEGEPYFVLDYDLKKLQAAISEWEDIDVNIAKQFKEAISGGHLTHQWDACGRLSNGILAFDMVKPPNDDVRNITIKMTHAFEQAYTRFLDLQKAEARLQELQIEAAVEKVRSCSLAMHTSNELNEVVTVLFEKLKGLGVPATAAGIGIFVEGSNDQIAYVCGEVENRLVLRQYRLPYFDTLIANNLLNARKNGLDFFIGNYNKDETKSIYEKLFELPELQDMPNDVKQMILQSEHYTISTALSKNSVLSINDFQGNQLSEIEIDILKRFAKVFEQSYIRFLDLQVKEEQAVKLFEEKQRLEKTLAHLQTTQKQLIQSEKMASLGELTAGIAHEIQNPLNFVNNFSELSSELLDEMNEEIAKGDFEEAKAIANDIKQNLEKINHHGKRADNIVKGMLQHSRKSAAAKEPTAINKLTDEFLRLAYHGLRAKDKSFNAKLITDFDEGVGNVPIIAQDMGRVILNLITNAFYAVHEKKKNTSDDYQPTVSVSTKNEGDQVLILVKDNGNGIPPEVLDKIFQPFFTTKPTGQGTGLGLSMSYDIVKAHGGELMVATEKGLRTVFKIILPLK